MTIYVLESRNKNTPRGIPAECWNLTLLHTTAIFYNDIQPLYIGESSPMTYYNPLGSNTSAY